MLAGTIAGHAGPVETSIPITYGHATLAPGDAVEWEVADGETALAHVFDGAADVSGTSARSGQLVVHERSSGVVRVSVPADGEGAEILLLGGRPIDEPIARHGPFVMNTREEIVQAVDDFNAGRLGSIPAVGSGVSHP